MSAWLALAPISLPQPPPRSFSVSVAGAIQRQPGEAIDAVYGTEFPLELEVRAGALWGERFGVGLVVGLQHRTGEGIAAKGPLPVTILWQIPVAAEGRLRLVLRDEQAFVPVLRAGLGVVAAIERWSVEDGDSGVWRGVKAAVHVAGGFQLRLPFPEFSFRGPSFGASPIRDIYLQVEGRLRSAADFGRAGLDLSGAGLVVGLTLLL
jgi:hypothetical protein